MPEDERWEDDRSSWSLDLPGGADDVDSPTPFQVVRVHLQHVGTQPGDYLLLDISFESRDLNRHDQLRGRQRLRFSRDEWCRAVIQMRLLLQEMPPEKVRKGFDSGGHKLLDQWPEQVTPPVHPWHVSRRPNIVIHKDLDRLEAYDVAAQLYSGEFREVSVDIMNPTWLRVFSASLTVWASPAKPDWDWERPVE